MLDVYTVEIIFYVHKNEQEIILNKLFGEQNEIK